MRLAKAGYCGGDPQKILELPVGMVIAMLDYERFEGDYQDQYLELNKGGA